MRKFNILKVVAKKQKEGLENVIHSVNWSYEHIEGEDFAHLKGSSQLPEPDPDNFIASENVTIGMVIEWVEASLSEEGVVRLNTLLDNQLNEVVLDIK